MIPLCEADQDLSAEPGTAREPFAHKDGSIQCGQIPLCLRTARLEALLTPRLDFKEHAKEGICDVRTKLSFIWKEECDITESRIVNDGIEWLGIIIDDALGMTDTLHEGDHPLGSIPEEELPGHL